LHAFWVVLLFPPPLLPGTADEDLEPAADDLLLMRLLEIGSSTMK
jgi:hypothetical protein